MFLFSVLSIAMSLSSFAAAQSATSKLPDNLSKKLGDSTASCTYQMFVSHSAKRLAEDSKFKASVRRRLDVPEFYDRLGSVWGLSLMGAGASILATQITSFLPEPLAISGGLSFFGGLSSVYAASTDLEKPRWSLDKENADTYASKVSMAGSKLLGLDALKQEAFRAELLKNVLAKIARNDSSPLSISSVLKSTRLRGFKILSENDFLNLDLIEKEAAKPQKEGSMTDLDRANFLGVCQASLLEQLPNLRGDERVAVEKVISTGASVLKDLEDYDALHPGQPKFGHRMNTFTDGWQTQPIGTSMDVK